MKLVAQIQAAYQEIDDHLSKQAVEALDAGNSTAQQEYTERRRLNDNAYFVLVWGQLENDINEKFAQIVVAGVASPDWNTRRQFYNYDVKGENFYLRLSLLTEKGGGPGSAWKKVVRYYELRNKIAHGQSDMSGVSMQSVVPDLYSIQSLLASS